MAVAKVSLRQKEYLCCLRPFEDGIMMETMHYPDEIRGMAELNLPESEAVVTEQEMGMAHVLIDQLTGAFDPGNYRDEYRFALETVIENKLVGGQPVTPTPVAAQGKVGDLMEALKASIEATKSERTPKKKAAAKSTTKKEAAPRKSKAKVKA